MIRYSNPGHVRVVIDVAVPVSAYPEMILIAREEARKIDTAMAHTSGMPETGTFIKKADDALHLISPPPGLPRQGEGVITSLPGWEGLREGDKMMFTFFWVIDPKINETNTRIGDKALRLGGTAIGEHGVGIGKAKFMAAEHGSALEWMKKVKALFDPNDILNPGKMFP